MPDQNPPAEPPSRFPDGDLGAAAELGAITDRSARVWVRQPGAEGIALRIEVEGRREIETVVSLSAERDWTGAAELTLPEPAPNARFVVNAGERRLVGRFAPSPGEHAGFAFAFGSCHYPFEVDDAGIPRLRRAARIYPALREELLAEEARFLLLIGDQLYADAVPPLSVRDELPGGPDDPPRLELLTAAYRRITGGYFAERGFRALREALPTQCIWDDHDIFNNWGSLKRETPLDARLFEAASRVFAEYQDGRNPGGGDRPPFDFAFGFGTAAFIVLDLRGARSYAEGTLLGRAQWQRFFERMASEEVQGAHTLFVVSSVPVAHASRWLALLFERLPGDYGEAVRDRWVASKHLESRDALLDALFAWQEAQSERQVVLLSGDIHEADAVAIRRRGRPGTIWQFTGSAFTSPPSTKLHRFNWVATRAPNLFESRFRFERRFLLPVNNAGLVRLTARPEGGHEIRFAVRAWDAERERLFTAGEVTIMPNGRKEDT
jgi:phosphodiesterase/alkaline phosphatase D-like protein